MVLGNSGGGLAAIGSYGLIVDGAIDGAPATGPLFIGIPPSSANASSTTGRLPGTGTGTANTTELDATGTVILSGDNFYPGGTVLYSGTLVVSNSIGSGTGTGNVIVNSKCVLGGGGTIAGGVTVNLGGETWPSVQSPGTGVTTTIGGNVTYVAGANCEFYLTSSASGGNDQIVLNGAGATLVCGGNTVSLTNASGTLDTQDYVLFNLTGSGATPRGVSIPRHPGWGQPGNSGSYSVVTLPTEVILHYQGTPPPTNTFTSVCRCSVPEWLRTEPM